MPSLDMTSSLTFQIRVENKQHLQLLPITEEHLNGMPGTLAFKQQKPPQDELKIDHAQQKEPDC